MKFAKTDKINKIYKIDKAWKNINLVKIDKCGLFGKIDYSDRNDKTVRCKKFVR